jgi:hypothetical protein
LGISLLFPSEPKTLGQYLACAVPYSPRLVPAYAQKEFWYGPNCSVFPAKLAFAVNVMAYREPFKPKVEDSDTSELLTLRNTSVEKTVEKLFADLPQKEAKDCLSHVTRGMR